MPTGNELKCIDCGATYPLDQAPSGVTTAPCKANGAGGSALTRRGGSGSSSVTPLE